VSVAQAFVRNVGTCCLIQREKAKWWTHEAESTEAGRGTEQPVVAMKPAKADGAKGLRHSALIMGQPDSGRSL
jgi:hypothetical protein